MSENPSPRKVTIVLDEETAYALLERARDEATSQMYGGFAGGDPRDFVPDEECSTPEERAAHKAACEAWERGEGEPMPPSCRWESLPNGTTQHSQRNYFGLGTNTYRDSVMTELAAALGAALGDGR